MATSRTRKRFQILILSVLALFVTSWLELFLQRKQTFFGTGINQVFLFLLINVHVIIIIILLYIIIRQSIKLFVELHRQTPGSSFKRNLLFAFTIFSVVPSFLVFFTAGKLITKSIDDWFHARISIGLKNSIVLHEQQTFKLRLNLKNHGNLLFQEIKKLLKEDPEQIQKKLNIISQEQDYKLYLWGKNGQNLFGSIDDEINIWKEYHKLNDRSIQNLKNEFLNIINDQNKMEDIFDFYGSLYFVKQIKNENSNLIPNQKPITNIFIVLAKRYDNNIRNPLIAIQNSIYDYEQLKSMRNPIYWNYLFTFILVTLLILFLSIWCAFYLSRGISRPIHELLKAIEKIRRGHLDVKVGYETTSDLKNLAIGFNEMTKALQQAYNQLEQKNKDLFLILENIKEAVFFVDNFGRILTYNSASKELIAKYLGLSRFKNKKINFLGPDVTKTFFKLVRQLIKSQKDQLTEEVSFTFNSELNTLRVHFTHIKNPIAKPSLKDSEEGLLVVIEDLTNIVKINKIKTWQEAAKQMAHEIKNPLTPIQLATQRLQRKFRKTLNEDTVFLECTNTILSHVKIIKDLVSHFSEFAQMPTGQIESIDLNNITKDVTSLYEHSYPEIEFVYDLQKYIPLIKVDKKKIKRVIINLLDNSVRALKQNKEIKKIITIKTNFTTGRNQIELLVCDNGPGIPKHVKDKLFLPYVSGEKKNMGLGLAIVHEIITQIGASIKLLPAQTGATFQILIPV